MRFGTLVDVDLARAEGGRPCGRATRSHSSQPPHARWQIQRSKREKTNTIKKISSETTLAYRRTRPAAVLNNVTLRRIPPSARDARVPALIMRACLGEMKYIRATQILQCSVLSRSIAIPSLRGSAPASDLGRLTLSPRQRFVTCSRRGAPDVMVARLKIPPSELRRVYTSLREAGVHFASSQTPSACTWLSWNTLRWPQTRSNEHSTAGGSAVLLRGRLHRLERQSTTGSQRFVHGNGKNLWCCTRAHVYSLTKE